MAKRNRTEAAKTAPLENSTTKAPTPHWHGEESVQSLRHSGAYVVTAPAGTVIGHVDMIRESDHRTQRRQAWSYAVCGVGALLAVGGVLAMAQGSSAGVLLVVGAVTAAVGFGFAMSFRGSDFENRRYELVAGLVNLLKADMAAEAPLSVQLDLRPTNHARKLHHQGNVRGWNVDFYVDRWLDLQGRFVDGTRYAVTVIEKHQSRHRTKRSASGKVKSKRKQKYVSEAVVRLKVKSERYPGLAKNAQGIKSALKLPRWASIKKFEVGADTMALRVALASSWDAAAPGTSKPASDAVHLVAMMFLGMYHALNQLRARKSA